MKYHIHVYELAKKGEVSLVADTEADAMQTALDRVKSGEMLCDLEPDTKHLALAFPVIEEE